MLRTLAFACCLLSPLSLGWTASLARGDEPTPPLTRAHAHNDYHHPRPLADALDQGFCSVESDVFLVDDQLLVGHDRGELRADRTLRTLYLDPLQQRARQHGGRIYRDGPVFSLLVDIKSEAVATWNQLNRELAQYPELVSHHDGQAYQQRAVQVIVSGNRAWENISMASPSWAGIDGRLSDLSSELPAHVLPWISDNWTLHFTWRGDGTMPEQERNKLQSIVQQAHRRGRRVRFWATPESPALWQQLHDAEVDLINTDQLAQLATYLRSQEADTP
jgi:hypothetical protein